MSELGPLDLLLLLLAVERVNETLAAFGRAVARGVRALPRGKVPKER